MWLKGRSIMKKITKHVILILIILTFAAILSGCISADNGSPYDNRAYFTELAPMTMGFTQKTQMVELDDFTNMERVIIFDEETKSFLYSDFDQDQYAIGYYVIRNSSILVFLEEYYEDEEMFSIQPIQIGIVYFFGKETHSIEGTSARVPKMHIESTNVEYLDISGTYITLDSDMFDWE